MLQIRLLGQFDVRWDGKRVVIPSRAGQSLLAYLALTAGTSHRREKLAGTLWPDTSDENARKNLRQELWRIRKAIPNQSLGASNDYLLSNEYTLTFNRDADYWLDVAILERPDLDPQSLTSSLSLYQGELLPGFYDDWIVLERERIQTLFESKIERLVEKLLEAERWTAVQEQSERWLALGNTPEPAYRALMLSHSARGDMAKVSSTYQRCVDDLRNQLSVEPSAETHALYNGLLKGARAPRRVVPAQPSGTVTFLFTDIQDSTRLLDNLGQQYATALVEHHKILRAAIQKWNGSEMDTQGDAFFVTFARALDAIKCAAEAQRMFADHRWPSDEPVRVRMGLHTGEPLITSTGYVGMDVHRAARIGDAGHGGQILLSQTTRELVIHDLPHGVTIRDLGAHRLKDLKYPTPIYQLVMEGLPAEFPPLKTKFTGTEVPTPGEPPFKGLQYFEEEDSELFFGRELLTAKLVNRLRETRFLSVIIGASGSGKSSLVRAGLIPTLKKGAELIDGTKPPKDSSNWQIHIITPTARPLEALATQLTRASESVTATATLLDDLTSDPRSLSLFLARKHLKQHTLLVIDQFEELFTLCREEFQREAFVDNLLSAIHSAEGRMTLIITLRADFYAHLSQYPELRDAVAKQQEYIGPMTTEELRRAIEEPARRGHWEFEPGLVDLILRDVGDEPGALPLLSHALLETWKRRAGHTLTLKGYADAGGVHGAIAHTAEGVYQNLTLEEQVIARNIFLRLTEFGEGTEDTRRRAPFDELMSHAEDAHQVHAVLDRLAEARLVTLSENTAEVAHEALIREWAQLREWLSQDREGIMLHRHLTEAAHEWELLERDADALYRGARLAQANEWSALNPDVLNAHERMFIDASNMRAKREEQEREEQHQRELAAAKELAATQRQSATHLRMRNRVITTVGTIALILALLAARFGLQSNQNAITAQANLARSEAQRLAAEASSLMQSGVADPQLIALLSLRSIKTQYTPQGDAALTGAAALPLPRQIFSGHTEGLLSVAFSPDDRYILTGSRDDTALLWDTQTGQELRQFAGHLPGPRDGGVGAGVRAVFSPDGQYVLTGGYDGIAKLWGVETGEELRVFSGHSDAVSGIAFSPDGKYVLTGGLDHTARLWETQSGKALRQFRGHTDGLRGVAFSPDGRYIVTTSSDKTARLWDVKTGQELRVFSGHTHDVWSVAFSPDGRYIITGSYDGTARLWDVETDQELRQFTGHTDGLRGVAFSPDGKFLLTGSADKIAKLWDVQTGRELHQFSGETDALESVAYSSNGRYILTGGGDKIAWLWDLQHASGEHSLFIGHTNAVYGIDFSPDGQYVATGSADNTARLWNAQTGEELRQFIGHTDWINSVAFSPDGRFLLTGSGDKMAKLWDVQTGQELRTFKGHTAGLSILTFSPDGQYVLTGAWDGTARRWETQTGKIVTTYQVGDGPYGVAFSPEGQYVLTGDFGSKKLSLWNAQTGERLRQFTGHTEGVNGVAFSSDGRFALGTSYDKTARLWDVQTGKELQILVGHTAFLWSGTFSPDGKVVLTAGGDNTARLWDIQTGQELRRFTGHTGPVEWVVFSPDGEIFATASDDGTARLWDVDYRDTVRYLCSILLRDFTDEERTQYDIMYNTQTCSKP